MNARSLPTLLCLVLLLAWPAALPAGDPDDLPEDLTELGRFEGSWVYRSRDERIALFFETHDGAPRLRWRYESRRRPDAFETGWDGAASYFAEGRPGSFRMELTERGEHLMRGRLTWSYPLPRGAEKQDNGEFVIYRTGNGRTLALQFERYEEVLSHPEREPKSHVAPRKWVFVKASKRVVRWEELPI